MQAPAELRRGATQARSRCSRASSARRGRCCRRARTAGSAPPTRTRRASTASCSGAETRCSAAGSPQSSGTGSFGLARCQRTWASSSRGERRWAALRNGANSPAASASRLSTPCAPILRPDFQSSAPSSGPPPTLALLPAAGTPRRFPTRVQRHSPVLMVGAGRILKEVWLEIVKQEIERPEMKTNFNSTV